MLTPQVNVKNQITIVVVLVVASVWLSAQTKPAAKPSLKETISWMTNFSAEHGFVTFGNQMMRGNSLSGRNGCTVSFEIHYPKSTSSSQVKAVIASIVLADFDPNAVREVTDKDNGIYEVDFERSDAAFKIEEETEMGDGTRRTMYVAQETLFFDSEESAKRFARALSYAITLCGGVPAPF